MATTATSILEAGLAVHSAKPAAGQTKRRSIDARAGRALVILGHAIEYLADEFVEQGVALTGDRGQLEAIRLLMDRNREVYLECPEAPTLWQWVRSALERRLPALERFNRQF